MTNHQQNVYLDYNASTPLHPEVAAVMRDCLSGFHGNPSAPHWAGSPAKRQLEAARQKVATLLGCTTDEIVFTSGGSESNNQVLKGMFFDSNVKAPHIITSAVEHPAIVEPCHFLEEEMHFFSVFSFMTLAHMLITIGVSIRVIKVRLPVATSLAWLILDT